MKRKGRKPNKWKRSSCDCFYCTGHTKEEYLKIKHKAKVLTKQEVEEGRSNAYKYIL